jgi:nicotinamide-nucleotide amidase
VRSDTLARHGSVSEQAALEMALGALERSRATVALAITGIAGPGGGSPDKPVGTVCFAWARKDRPASAETRHFAGDREAVRRQSVEHALERLLQLLDEG